MKRFYTLAPRCFNWSFLLVNIRNQKELRNRNYKHVILDAGVERFLDMPNLHDYPNRFLWQYKQRAEILNHQTQGKLWVTIPDYPDDYNPGQFGDNISKTLENIKDFISVEGINWMPVLQSRYLNRFSFLESCERTKEIIGDYPQIAIGTVCKCRKLSFIEYCCKVARKKFPKSWLHAFGLTLKAIPKTKDYIDSFDSMAWTFPRTRFKEWCETTGLKPFPNPGWSYDSESLNPYFQAYIDRLREIVNLEK